MRPFKRRHNSIKGPVFPSFHNARGGPRQILVWTPGTQSTRQVKRNLRNKARKIIDSNDEVIISIGDRVIRAVCAEPDPEYAALHLFCAALDASDDTGESWAVCMQYLMDQFDVIQKKHSEEHPDAVSKPEKEVAAESTSLLRRLFRAVAKGAFRSLYEAAAEADVDQQSGAGDGVSSGASVDSRAAH